MKYLSLFIILLFTVSNINSQNTLLGTIHDNNNQSIEVTIYIPKLEKGTISDLNGNFKLEQIPNGTFNVLYSSLGYVTISKKITFLNNQSVTQNIIMLESAIEMDEVIISTPFHKLQGENVMKVERLSAKELSKSGSKIYIQVRKKSIPATVVKLPFYKG